jgi:hypothetical protein
MRGIQIEAMAHCRRPHRDGADRSTARTDSSAKAPPAAVPRAGTVATP